MIRANYAKRRRQTRALRSRRLYLTTCALIASFAVAATVRSMYPAYRATQSLTLDGRTLPAGTALGASDFATDHLEAAYERAVVSVSRGHRSGFVITAVTDDASVADMPGTVSVAFTIFAEARDPRAAERVVDAAAAALLDDHEMAAAARAVPDQEVEAARRAFEAVVAELGDAERELQQFEQENAAMLPGLEELNRKVIQESDRKHAELAAELRTLESRRVELDRALADLQRGANRFGGDTPLTSEILAAAQARWAVLRGRSGSDHPQAVELGTALTEARAAVDSRVGALEAELEAARAAYDSAQRRMPIDHPDVVSLAHRVSALELAISETRVTGLSGRDLTAIEELSRERIAIDGVIANLRDQVAALEQARLEQEAHAALAPALEQRHALLKQQVTDVQQRLDAQRERYHALSETVRAALWESPGVLSVAGEVQTRRLVMTPPAMLAGLIAMPLMLLLSFLLGRLEHGRSTISGPSAVARLQGRPPLASIPELQGS